VLFRSRQHSCKGAGSSSYVILQTFKASAAPAYYIITFFSKS